MHKKKIFYISITALLIAILHFIFNPYRVFSYDYDLKLGEIAEKDIIAPYDFFVYKNKDTLLAEQDAAAAKVDPIYKISENLKFSAQKNLDFIFQHFTLSNIQDTLLISEKLLQNGYNISNISISNLMNNQRRLRIYNLLTEELTKIFNIGIYSDNIGSQKIKVVKLNKIIEYDIKRLYSLQEAKTKLITNATSDVDKQIVSEITDLILITNIVIDNDLTELEKQKAREHVPLTLGKVQKNELIIGKNQKVGNNELLKLQSLQRAQREQNMERRFSKLMFSSLGIFAFSFYLLGLLIYIIQIFYPKEFSSSARTIIILSSILVSIILTIIVNVIMQIPSLIIPYSFGVLIIAAIFSPHLGVVFNFVNFLFVALFLNWSIINPLIMCVATMAGIVTFKRMKQRLEYYPLTIYILLSAILMVAIITLIRQENFIRFLWLSLWALVSTVVSIILLILFIPLIERWLNLASKQILLELLDFENPLLKKMSMMIPGTYHHSLIVGNLAESAAEAIDANYLLARVGSYYHDIGKLENPSLFIENNPNSTEIHDQMMANESARLIKNHIQHGIALAKQNKLPQPVIEILQQHHGTTKLRFFINKAQETNLEFDDEQFQYDGPKPKSKEAAIVMIADIVESTTKSLTDFTEEAIENVLDKTVKYLISEGQLDETPITLKELDTIKKYMLPILMGVYRKRLEYPE